MELSYPQLLANIYSENANAKDQLVHHDEPEEDISEYEQDSHDELENQEEFTRPAIRHTEGNVIVPKNTVHDTKLSIRAEKDISTLVFCVDSRFRDFAYPYVKNQDPFKQPGDTETISNVLSSASYFAFQPHRAIKNAVSVKIKTIEIPNTFYTFSAAYGNTTFTIQLRDSTGPTDFTASFTIPDGNYFTVDELAAQLQTTIRASLVATVQFSDFTVVYNANTNRITIASGNPNILFYPDFTASFTARPFTGGIAYNLGFLIKNTYTAYQQTYVAENAPDVLGFPYIYLQLNDWNVVEHQSTHHQYFSAFAKILLNVPKNTIAFDTNISNTVTKEYFFTQPTTISKLIVRLVDPFGNQLDLRGSNFSFSIEIKEILNMAMYEKLREL
jgi:hypothetical protein